MLINLIGRRTKLLSANFSPIPPMMFSKTPLLVCLPLILLLTSIGSLSYVEADELQEKGKINTIFSVIILILQGHQAIFILRR